MIIYQSLMEKTTSNTYVPSVGVFTLESSQTDKKLLYILGITNEEDITDKKLRELREQRGYGDVLDWIKQNPYLAVIIILYLKYKDQKDVGSRILNELKIKDKDQAQKILSFVKVLSLYLELKPEEKQNAGEIILNKLKIENGKQAQKVLNFVKILRGADNFLTVVNNTYKQKGQNAEIWLKNAQSKIRELFTIKINGQEVWLRESEVYQFWGHL